MNLYLLFKFLHVVAAAVWVGGMVVNFAQQARLSRETNPEVMRALTGQAAAIGQRVVGPAAGLTLILGGLDMYFGNLGLQAWIVWGLVSVALAMVLGGTVVRRASEALIARLATAGPGDGEVEGLRRRLSRLQVLLLVILLSAVWAMVFKPTL
jgi:uncharacterized membrane protein